MEQPGNGAQNPGQVKEESPAYSVLFIVVKAPLIYLHYTHLI